jgi:DHA3 family macrolide efflux protein-like MFS transporter
MKNHVLYLFADFRRLFLARLISSVGDKFYTIALAWYILTSDTEHGKTQLGLLMAVNLLPIVLFGPIIGTLTDRWDKQKCMMLADIIRAGLVGLLAFLMHQQALTLPIIYIVSFLQALCVPLFDTATQSSITLLTGKDHITQAVSMNASVTQISAVLGALLGSVLIHLIGIEGAFWVNAISYAMSTILVLRIATPLKSLVTRAPFFIQFKEGMQFLKHHKPIYSLLFLFGLLNLFVAPLMLLLPILVKSDLHQEANTLAVFEAFLALGSLVMTVYLSFRPTKHHVYTKLFASCLLLGMCMSTIAVGHSIIQIVVLLVIIGLMLSFTNAIAMSLFHKEVPADMKGRFFAVLYTIVFAVMPLSYSVVGFISNQLSTYQIFGICGVAVTLLSLIILVIPRIKTIE